MIMQDYIIGLYRLVTINTQPNIRSVLAICTTAHTVISQRSLRSPDIWIGMCDSQKSREKFQTLFSGSGHESTFIVTCRLGLGATPPQDLTVRVYQIQLETRVRRKVLGKGRNHPRHWNWYRSSSVWSHIYTYPLYMYMCCSDEVIS